MNERTNRCLQSFLFFFFLLQGSLKSTKKRTQGTLFIYFQAVHLSLDLLRDVESFEEPLTSLSVQFHWLLLIKHACLLFHKLVLKLVKVLSKSNFNSPIYKSRFKERQPIDITLRGCSHGLAVFRSVFWNFTVRKL